MTTLSVISSCKQLGSSPDVRTALLDVSQQIRVLELARGQVDADRQLRRQGTASCHSRIWRQASSSTHLPIGTIRPVSSASGMKSSGWDQALLGVLPAHQRLQAA